MENRFRGAMRSKVLGDNVYVGRVWPIPGQDGHPVAEKMN